MAQTKTARRATPKRNQLPSSGSDPLDAMALSDPLVEQAKSQEERSQGLKGRSDLGMGDGMLFTDDKTGPQNFHMEDTPKDLDIAFADESGVVSSTDHMEANKGRAEGKGKYALEMPSGSFEKQGVKEGTPLNTVPGVPL
jgi:uncharacterized protein